MDCLRSYHTLEGCFGFGDSWESGPNANLTEAGGFTFAAGGSGRSENLAGDPRGTVGFGM